MNQTSINKTILNQQFQRYVTPCMITMLLSGFYAIVDGLFVGNAIGNHGLAAINLVYPIQMILNAAALGIGIGGAVVLSNCHGKQDEQGMAHAMASTLTLLIIIGILLPILLSLLTPYLLQFLGATPQIYEHSHTYISIALFGGLLPILGNGLNPLLRNQGNTYLATFFMSCGLITNIILDYLFVFEYDMGLGGAALATILAQGIVAFLSISYLWKFHFSDMKRKDFLPSFLLIKKMARIGFSPFGQTLAPSFIIVITNWMCLRYGGNEAMTIYSVVSYILSSVQLLLQGIGDGVQPLISFYYGADKKEEVHYLYRRALTLTIGFSIVLFIGVICFLKPLISLFGVSISLMEATKTAVMISAVSFPFQGIVRLTAAFFYASEKNAFSSILVYIEPCIVLPVALVLCTTLFQLHGIWIAYPAAQITMALLATVMTRLSKDLLLLPSKKPQYEKVNNL